MSENGPTPPADKGLSQYDIRMLTQLPRRKGTPPTAEQIAASRLSAEGKSSADGTTRKQPRPRRGGPNERTRRYSTNLKAQDIETLTRIAEEERRPVSTLVRHIIEDWLAAYEARRASRDGDGA